MKSSFYSYKVVEEELKRGELLFLSKALELKMAYKGTIYNYSPTRVAKQSRVQWSAQTIRNLVNKLIRKGWCRVTKRGNLVFIPKKELHRKYSKRTPIFVKIDCKPNYKDIKAHLQGVVLSRKLFQMQFRKNQQFNRSQKTSADFRQKNEGLRISLLKIAKLFGYKSESTSNLIVKKVVSLQLISKRSFRPKIVFDFNVGFRFKSQCNEYKLAKS